MQDLTVTIDWLGGEGDGAADTPTGRLFVPFTAQGDVARVRPTGKTSAKLIELLTPGPARTAPPCRHFTRCGGCSLQHLDPGFVAGWKRDRIVRALGSVGLDDVTVEETISIPPGTRRRATLAAKRLSAGVVLGFAERASHRLIDLAECPVLRPELTALIPPLRTVLSSLLTSGEDADIALTLSETGTDLTLIRERPLSLPDRETLSDFAQSQDLARVAWRPSIKRPVEPVSERRTPVVRFAGYAVTLSPSAFLQPSEEGEAVLTRLVSEALAGVKAPIVDLFCGLGTFALPASRTGPVVAYDSDGEAVAAVRRALNTQNLASRMSVEQRDLFRDPLTRDELQPFGAAIMDPPRAGALAQAKWLATSDIAVIAAASCNPSSFARDAAILTEGGYRLERVTPVDQFLWSTHVELVGVFRR